MNPVAVLLDEHYNGQHFRALRLWCPGCDLSHRVTLTGPTGDVPPVCWDFDGNLDAPTLSPSLLVQVAYGPLHDKPGDHRCHSFVRAGRWEFLSDCTHELAGQTVPLPPVPDWLAAKAK